MNLNANSKTKKKKKIFKVEVYNKHLATLCLTLSCLLSSYPLYNAN